jgi:hypothetical protein
LFKVRIATMVNHYNSIKVHELSELGMEVEKKSEDEDIEENSLTHDINEETKLKEVSKPKGPITIDMLKILTGGHNVVDNKSEDSPSPIKIK